MLECKVYMEQISSQCLDFGSIPKIYYVSVNILNSQIGNTSKSKHVI